MKSYQATITKKLQMTADVEASSRYEAQRFAEKHWKSSDYILDADHFKGVTFTAAPPKKKRGDKR